MTQHGYDSIYEFQELTQKFRVRQFEYHPQQELLIFGTLKGNICTVDLEDSKNKVTFLGNHGGKTTFYLIMHCS